MAPTPLHIHSELLGPILGSVERQEVEVDLWSCWVSGSFDDSETLSRVFLFDDMLLLVVPTAAMFDIKEDDIFRNLWKLCATTFGSCH